MTFCDLCYGPSNTGSPCAFCIDDRLRADAASEARVEEMVSAYQRELEANERSAA